MVDPVSPNRDQIRRVIGNDERFVIALERLFQVGGGEIPDNILALQRRIEAREQIPMATDAAIREDGRDVLRGLNSRFFVFVSDKFDFPAAVSNVIQLEDGVTYYVIADIDLEGCRLVGGQNTAIIGTSSETSFIRSTGLGAGTALITSEWTMPIRHISLEAETIFDLDAGANPLQALDWYGVNLLNTTDIGRIANYNNFVVNSMAFLSASGLEFDGTMGTVSFANTLFSGASTGAILSLPATAVITRRFRVIYSAFVVPAAASGIDVSASATIPVESYILDTCNFSGAGSYIVGVQHNDNKSLFVNNVGISNSANVSNYYMNGNATATTIGSAGVPVKIAGTTTSGSITQRFTNSTTNRATYNGAVVRTFKVDAIASVGGATSRNFSVYVAINGSVVASSKSSGKTNASGDPDQVFSSAIVTLSQGDYAEAWVSNDDTSANLTVVDLNVLVGII